MTKDWIFCPPGPELLVEPIITPLSEKISQKTHLWAGSGGHIWGANPLIELKPSDLIDHARN